MTSRINRSLGAISVLVCGIQLAWIAGCNSDEVQQNSASNSASATEVTETGASQATQASMTMPTEGSASNTATDSVSGTDSDSMTATDSSPTSTVTVTATDSTTVGVTDATMTASNTDTDATASNTNTDGTVSATDTDGTASATDTDGTATDTDGTATDTDGTATDTDTGMVDTDTGQMMCEAPDNADECEKCVAEECNKDYCDCAAEGDCLCVLSCLDQPNLLALTTCLLTDCLLNELDLTKLLKKATQSVDGILECNALLNPTKCGVVCSAVEFLGG